MEYIANYAVLLLLVGIVLLIAEIFIPSGGMILVLALICLISSVWCAWKAWWGTNYWWTYIGAIVVLIPSVIGGMMYLFPKTPIGKRILLEAQSLDEVSAFNDDVQRLRLLVGRNAKTVTMLNPGGLVEFNGERFHCQSEGMIVDPGEDVEIIGVSATRLIVRPVDKAAEKLQVEDDSATFSQGPVAAEDVAEEDRPLDFDIPES